MNSSKVIRKDLAYHYLREQIINCVLKPGETIFEDKIAESLNISKTPVRQAIHKLEKDGLVCIFPRKGITVTEISLSLVHEIFETRLLIEPHLGRSACGKIDTSVLTEFRKRFQRLNLEKQESVDHKILKIDWDFHNTIIVASHNRFLIDTMQNIYAHYHRLRILAAQGDPAARKRFTIEHLDIIDKLIEGDRDLVESLFRQHVQGSYEDALRVRIL